MREIKDYIWIVILIGGILTLVSILTPVSYVIRSNLEYYTWMWGLSFYNLEGWGSEISFRLLGAPTPRSIPRYLSRLIPTIFILLSSIILIIIANRLRVGITQIKEIENKLIGWGVITILGPIFFMITLNITMTVLNGESYVLFSSTSPGFAFIGPFIGGSLTLISGIVSKTKISREEVTRIAETKDFITKTGAALATATTALPIISQISFCPECGQKVFQKGGKFCANCGFDFRI